MKKILTAMLAIVGLCILINQANAYDLILAWDPNNPAPEEYQGFQRVDGEQYDFTDPACEPGSDTTCTITGLTRGVKYLFVVRAVTGGVQGANSNEVEYTGIEPEPGVEPPVLRIYPDCTDLAEQVERLTALLELFLSGVHVEPDPPVTAYTGNDVSMVYHAPGCRYHGCAACQSTFTSREEAEAAGYRPGRLCGTD